MSAGAHAGSAIEAMRKACGLTLRDLAKLAETSPSYLSQVERGDRDPSRRWLDTVTQGLVDTMEAKRLANPKR